MNEPHGPIEWARQQQAEHEQHAAELPHGRLLLDQHNDASLAALYDRAEQAEVERDGAYRERAHLVAHLASLYPSQIAYTDPEAPDWPVVTIETPAGQMSWHIAPRDVELFERVERRNGLVLPWDGHTTEQKYERLQRLTTR